MIFLVVVAFVNNILLIPIYGIEGAALATAISTFLNSLLRFIFIWKIFKLQPYNLQTLKLCFIILFCFAVNFFIPKMDHAVFDIILRSLAISGIYLAGIYLLKIAPEFHKYIPSLKNNNRPFEK